MENILQEEDVEDMFELSDDDGSSLSEPSSKRKKPTTGINIVMVKMGHSILIFILFILDMSFYLNLQETYGPAWDSHLTFTFIDSYPGEGTPHKCRQGARRENLFSTLRGSKLGVVNAEWNPKK